MAEQKLPWIPRPSPQTERAMSPPVGGRLYSQALTSISPRMTPISSQRESHHTAQTLKFVAGHHNCQFMPPLRSQARINIQSPTGKPPSSKSTSTFPELTGHESLPDMGRKSGAPITSLLSESDIHDHKVHEIIIMYAVLTGSEIPHKPGYSDTSYHELNTSASYILKYYS